MKKIGVIFVLILVLMCPLVIMAEENLITNASFEQFANNGEVSDWQPISYNNQPAYSLLEITSQKARSGEYSALIENFSPNDSRYVIKVKVEPSTYYKLSGYVWVESMENIGNGATFGIENVHTISKGIFEKSNNWVLIESYGLTGKTQTEVDLGVRVGGYSAESVGRAFFDDIKLEKIDSLPTNAHVQNWFAPENKSVNITQQSQAVNMQWYYWIFATCFLVFIIIFSYYRIPLSNLGICFASLLFIAIIVRVYLSINIKGYEVDINCFTAWSLRMVSHGPSLFYQPDYFCDYPPGAMLLLWPVGLILSAFKNLSNEWTLLIVKSIPLAFDIILGSTLYLLARKNGMKMGALFVSILYLLNPVVLANGVAWGQMDNVLAYFLLITIIYAQKQDWKLVFPIYMLSVLMKPQALLFGPIGVGYFIISICTSLTSTKKTQLKNAGKGLLYALVLALIVIIPFSIKQANPFTWIFNLYAETLASYGYVTLNTANLYYLFGGNWQAITSLVSPILMVLTLVAFLAVVATYIILIRKKANSFKIQMLCLFSVFACLNIIYYFINIDYSVYGYTMMAFGYLFSLLCLYHKRNSNPISYYFALTLIAIYVFSVKVHERYLFSALPLLLLSYIRCKDRRVLFVFAGLSLTTFFNTAIVLENSIVLGAVNGHLNMDTYSLNMFLSLANVLLAIYAFVIGTLNFKENTKNTIRFKANNNLADYTEVLLKKSTYKVKLSVKEKVFVLVVTLAYAVVAFFNLGSTVAPTAGYVSSSTDEEIVFSLEESSSFYLAYYGGVSYQPFSISVSEDGENWSEQFPCQLNEGMCYSWRYALNSYTNGGEVYYEGHTPSGKLLLNGKYIKLHTDYPGLNLFEIVAIDENGEKLQLKLENHVASRKKIDSPSPLLLIDEKETFVSEPSWYTGTYFDEIYHARTAYEHLHGINPYETTHPPLGKLLMSMGIAIFGMTPFGWRFAGTLIGVLMLPAIFYLALQITKNKTIAKISIMAFALDFMHFTQTRIATIDSFPVFFILLSYIFMVRYYQFDFLDVNCKKPNSIFDKNFWKGQSLLLCSGIAMGCSIASKWIGLYSAVGLAILFFVTILRQISVYCFAKHYTKQSEDEYENNRIFVAKTYTLKRVLYTCLLCVVYFILIPALIYYLCYIPYFEPSGGITISKLINAQQGMLQYHATPGLGMDHPFQSPWWEWPFIQKPMWYAQDSFEPTGLASTILCFGNPIIFYCGAIAMLAILLMSVLCYFNNKIKEWIKQKVCLPSTLFILSICFLVQYLPWVLVPRGMYIYHYFASVPFIIIATAVLLNSITNKFNLRKIIICLYITVALVAFIAFYPYFSGMAASYEWLDSLKWFSILYY